MFFVLAGLFFEVFVLIAAIAVSFVLFSFWRKKFWGMPFAVSLFVLNGALLLSEGLRYESGATLDRSVVPNVVTYVFSTASAAADASILLTAWTFIGLGVALGILSFVLHSRGGDF